MARHGSKSEDGFSLVEVIVAAGVICGAAMTLAGLCSTSAGLMAAARYRSYAVVLARARLDEWLAAAALGQPLIDGADAIDADGGVTSSPTPVYMRRWRFIAPALHADRLIACEVQVTPNIAAGVHGETVTIAALLERRP